MLKRHPFKLHELREVCDYLAKHVGETKAVYLVKVEYSPGGETDFLKLCPVCTASVRSDAERRGYKVTVTKL